MEVWVVVGLYDGILETCWVFDSLNAAKEAFKDLTRVDYDTYEKAYDEMMSKDKPLLSHPDMARWNHHVDAWIVNTTIE